MDARERRRAIMAVLESAKDPVSGSALAREVGVSRQVVVQDIALLRADGHDIVATNRGYVLQEAASSPAVPTRLVKVRHGVEQAGDELTSIVDAGGAVLNVIGITAGTARSRPTWTSAIVAMLSATCTISRAARAFRY